jgi:hypothetical protein
MRMVARVGKARGWLYGLARHEVGGWARESMVWAQQKRAVEFCVCEANQVWQGMRPVSGPECGDLQDMRSDARAEGKGMCYEMRGDFVRVQHCGMYGV